ncbi:unnamed protein product [Colias eurytheme]|nr:unnamed protein product [Colias eurytheme]
MQSIYIKASLKYQERKDAAAVAKNVAGGFMRARDFDDMSTAVERPPLYAYARLNENLMFCGLPQDKEQLIIFNIYQELY